MRTLFGRFRPRSASPSSCSIGGSAPTGAGSRWSARRRSPDGRTSRTRPSTLIGRFRHNGSARFAFGCPFVSRSRNEAALSVRVPSCESVALRDPSPRKHPRVVTKFTFDLDSDSTKFPMTWIQDGDGFFRKDR